MPAVLAASVSTRPSRLDVSLNGKLVGHLDDFGVATYTFAYIPGLGAQDRLSASLPLQEQRFLAHQTKPFFEGLLPEERVRTSVANQLGIDFADSFGLLAAIGGECAGAVTLTPHGQPPEPVGGITWLDDDELSERIENLPSFPLGRDERTRSRASLAGARRKLVAVVDGSRVGIPDGTLPTTHLLKPQWRSGPDDPQIHDIVANEAFCMRVAKRAGCDVANVEPRMVGQRPVLFVERFDRYRGQDGTVLRRHQEDMGQAAGQLPSSKYEEDGGMNLAKVADTAAMAGIARIVAVRALLDAIVVAAAVGNADQHAKNLGILYRSPAVLAPLYDITSTLIYDLPQRSAFVVGGELYIDAIGTDACVTAAEAFGMPVGQARSRVDDLTRRLHDAVPVALDEAQREGWHTPTVDQIAELITTWPNRTHGK